MHVKGLSAFGLSKNLESKYRVTTIFVVLLKNRMFKSIWHFCKAVFSLSSNESENCGEELICPRTSALQYGAIHIKSCNAPSFFLGETDERHDCG